MSFSPGGLRRDRWWIRKKVLVHHKEEIQDLRNNNTKDGAKVMDDLVTLGRK
jgi:hypothetical protein